MHQYQGVEEAASKLAGRLGRVVDYRFLAKTVRGQRAGAYGFRWMRAPSSVAAVMCMCTIDYTGKS